MVLEVPPQRILLVTWTLLLACTLVVPATLLVAGTLVVPATLLLPGTLVPGPLLVVAPWTLLVAACEPCTSHVASGLELFPNYRCHRPR